MTLKLGLSQLSDVDHPGKGLMATYCFACHKPQGEDQGRLAPPVAMVKQHYFTEGMERKEIVKKIMNWVEDPNWDHLQMSGAARRFGIMPKQGIPKESIRLIAEYIYDDEFNLAPECDDGTRGRKGRGVYSN